MSKLSKKDVAAAAANVKAPAEKAKKVYKKELGLSISTVDRGFNMNPEGFLMCKEIFQLLMERFDEKMMEKRVDSEFKGYSVKNAI